MQRAISGCQVRPGARGLTFRLCRAPGFPYTAPSHFEVVVAFHVHGDFASQVEATQAALLFDHTDLADRAGAGDRGGEHGGTSLRRRGEAELVVIASTERERARPLRALRAYQRLGERQAREVE